MDEIYFPFLLGSLWQQFDLCCLFDQIPESRHYPSIQDAIAILDRKMKKAKWTNLKHQLEIWGRCDVQKW